MFVSSKLSFFLSACAAVARSEIALVTMAAMTESGQESDEEFEERTSDELSTFYFGQFRDAVAQSQHELRKKRFDRVKKIAEIQCPDRASQILERLVINDAFEHMRLTAGCKETLEFIFSYFGDRISDHARKEMVLNAALYGSDDNLDTLRSFVGGTFVQNVINELERSKTRSGLCCNLLRASMNGDLAEVEKLLAVDGAGRKMFCPHVEERFAKAAAKCGHTHIVEAFFNKWRAENLDRDGRQLIALQREEALCIACQNGNLDLAVSMLSGMDIIWDPNQPPLRSPSVLLPKVFFTCTAKFLSKIIRVEKERLDNAGLQINPWWFENVLENAIRLRNRHHVETLLDELDPNRSKIDFTPLMPAVFRSRCASILRCVLIRYPEAATRNPGCDPVLVIENWHWPAGARLLVEAGVKWKGRPPAEHAGVFTLSLEDRCRIVARRSFKSPPLEVVEKLPLPQIAKRRFLYRWL